MAARGKDASASPHAARSRQPDTASRERESWKERESERRQQSPGFWQTSSSKRVLLPVPPESPNSKPLSRRKEIELLSAVLTEDSLNATQEVRELQTRDRVSRLTFCAAQQQKTPGVSTPQSQLNLQTELNRTQEVLTGVSIENGALTIENSKCTAEIHDLQVQLQLERR